MCSGLYFAVCTDRRRKRRRKKPRRLEQQSLCLVSATSKPPMESAAKAKRTDPCYISSLPYHIIKLIFCKLPVFSLAQSCRYVCKLWQQILMDPDFARFRLAMRTTTDLFLFIKDENLYWLEFHGKPHYFSLAANIDCRNLDFLNSCNGLVCASQFTCEYISLQDTKVLHVINPITCEYISLPPCEEGMRLLTRLCGVGFDPKTQKFKVLRCICPIRNFKLHQFEVCTLGNGTWRSIVNLPRFNGFFGNTCTSAFSNGCFHFLDGVRHKSAQIWAFDFASEQFRSMLLPPVFYDRNYDYCSENFGVARDSIIISCFADASKDLMEVWVMKEYGNVESWTKMLVIDCPLYSGTMSKFFPTKIRLLENGDVLLYYPPDLFLWKPKTRTLTKFDIQGIRFSINCPISHSPSFALLKDVVGDHSNFLE